MTTPQAWEAFQTELAVPEDVGADVLQSWRRSKWSGVDPEHVEWRMRDVPLESPFIRAAVPVMRRTADLLAGSSACLALADTDGTIIWRWVSDPELRRELDRVNVAERVVFAEELIGTNGVGTALESKQVATVLGASHYIRAFHDWACVAAPVIHPVTRRVCGAVNITCRAVEANQFLQIAIRSMARDVREALHSAATIGQKRLLDAYLARRPRTLAPLVAVNAKIVISDELSLEHAALWARLTSAGVNADTVELVPGVAARIWPVTDGTLADGAVLEILSSASQIALEPAPICESPLSALEVAERAIIVDALTRAAGNKSKAAGELKISRRSLYDKLHRYDIRL